MPRTPQHQAFCAYSYASNLCSESELALLEKCKAKHPRCSAAIRCKQYKRRLSKVNQLLACQQHRVVNSIKFSGSFILKASELLILSSGLPLSAMWWLPTKDFDIWKGGLENDVKVVSICRATNFSRSCNTSAWPCIVSYVQKSLMIHNQPGRPHRLSATT